MVLGELYIIQQVVGRNIDRGAKLFLKLHRCTINYTNNADVWNKNMNFYSNTYSQNYINTQNLWRLK